MVLAPLLLNPAFDALLVNAAIIIVALVVFGLHEGAQAAVGPIFRAIPFRPRSAAWLAVLGAVPLVGPIVAGPLLAAKLATSAYRAVLSRWTSVHLRPLTAWFTSINVLALGQFGVIAFLAGEAAYAIERLRHHIVPHAINARVRPLDRREAYHHRDLVRHDERLRVYARGIDRLQKDTVIPRVRANTRAVDVTLPRSIGRVRTREEALSRDQARLRKRTGALERGAIKTFEWLRTHPGSLAMGVFAGAVSIALGRMGLRFLRCRGWQRALGRVTCGMAGVLEDLLAVAFDVLALRDACRLMGTIEAAAIRAEPVITAFVLEIEGFVCGGDTSHPSGTVPSDTQRVSRLPSAVIAGVDY